MEREREMDSIFILAEYCSDVLFIKKIEQSLDLINTSDYGYCEDCGSEIGTRRLEARPTAVKCIDCKTYQEIREKQLGG